MRVTKSVARTHLRNHKNLIHGQKIEAVGMPLLSLFHEVICLPSGQDIYGRMEQRLSCGGKVAFSFQALAIAFASHEDEGRSELLHRRLHPQRWGTMESERPFYPSSRHLWPAAIRRLPPPKLRSQRVHMLSRMLYSYSQNKALLYFMQALIDLRA